MGAEQTRLSTDPAAYHRNFSRDHGISMWDQTPPKNEDYYNGKRFFKVGKEKYSRFTPGYFYGWNEAKQEEEDDFVILQSELSAIEEKKANLVAQIKARDFTPALDIVC